MEDYSEYLIQGEPDKRDRVRNWMAAIGLQDVDGLTPSNYMLETVRRNIEGEITIDEVSRLVDEYYSTQENELSTQETTAERIIAEIRKHAFTTGQQLAEVIGITPDGIKKQLDKLKKAGIIRHVGATKKGHWEIIEEYKRRI